MTARFIPSAILAWVLIIAGCKKADITADSNRETSNPIDIAMKKKPPVVNSCQVTQVVRWLDASTSLTMNFAYNTHGDPVSITQFPSHTGALNYTFEYDHKKRLTGFKGLHPGGSSGLFYHKYFYSSPSANAEIVMDSTYYFVTWTGEVMSFWYIGMATWYTYDSQGRIIRDSTVDSSFPYYTTVKNYSYDASGNRAGRTYDTKVNIHRTHKIWMFLDRDYSLNNPIIADTYNARGLPTSFDFPYGSGIYINFVEYMTKATITYDCD
jgi:hypothetical protein